MMPHGYWGPEFEQSEITALLANRNDAIELADSRIEEIGDEEALCRRTASEIAEGSVVS